MSMQSYVTALGHYQPDVRLCLEYPAQDYVDADEETWVFAQLFFCHGRQESLDLARLLRVKPWQFSGHHFDPWGVDEAGLLERWPDPFTGELVRFRQLRAAGFLFFFRPNY